jgi:phospholipase C
MAQPKTLFLWVLLLCTAGILVSSNGCGGGSSQVVTPPPPPPPQKIQHVIVVFQENRTPDNLFQDPKLIQAGADIVQSGLNSKGQNIPLTPISLAGTYDLSHSHDSFIAMYDGGKMDGADKVQVLCKGMPNCPPPNPQFKYITQSEVQPYFALAETYTFGDRMFQSNQGPSFPAHQFIISGTSAPSAPGDPLSNWFAADNPAGIPLAGQNTGCTAPPQESVLLIDPAGAESPAYPCYDHPTLTDLLDTKGISWRYYTPTAGLLWTGPNAIQHICGPNNPPPNATACVGSDWVNNVVINQKQVLTDITGGQLPSVSWVIPDGASSDHAGLGDQGLGPSWVASIVNAVGTSPYWANTAIIITWDDWGGWYDHVAPKIINSYEYGFRVPLIVVSPYAKAGYISKVTHDFGSILKYIETVFSLPTVSPGYADTVADDLSDCFDYTQTPLVFKTIPAQVDAKHFLDDKTPPTDPDDD